MDIKQALKITTNNTFQNIGSFTPDRLNNLGNLPVEAPTVEHFNEAIGAMPVDKREVRDALFGTHIREAVAIVRDWVRSP